jgi:hypothetical protein
VYPWNDETEYFPLVRGVASSESMVSRSSSKSFSKTVNEQRKSIAENEHHHGFEIALKV